jgi:hypothetical protein
MDESDKGRQISMERMRGILMVAVGVFVIWRGGVIHAHRATWPFFALGAVAIALGAWHLTRPAWPRR